MTGGMGVGRVVVGGGVGASESTSATTGALDQVGSALGTALALGTSLVLGATLALGAAVVPSGMVVFVSEQLVYKKFKTGALQLTVSQMLQVVPTMEMLHPSDPSSKTV